MVPKNITVKKDGIDYTYYMSREWDMAKYFMNKIIYFHNPVVSENKAWEWNI